MRIFNLLVSIIILFTMLLSALPVSAYTSPAVISVSPTDGETGVAINVQVTATFSEAMKVSSIKPATFYLTKQGGMDIHGNVDHDDTNTIFTLTLPPLDYNTSYTATVAAEVANEAGNPMENDYTWSFTTAGPPDNIPPTVISVSPTDGASGVVPYTDITATFSEAMNDSTITTANFNLWQSVTPVAGSVNWNSGSNTATFTPNNFLAYSKTYTASISTAVTDLAGNHLASTYTWSFTTAQPPPTVAVSVAAPDSVMAGSDFVVRVNVTQVTDLAGYDLKVTYDPAVVQIITPFPGQAAGTLWVTPGSIDSTVMPLTPPGFLPIGVQGTARIFGFFFSLAVVSGSGYLCEIHFNAVGISGQSSNITLSEVHLVDSHTIDIPFNLINSTVTIIGPTVTSITPNNGLNTGPVNITNLAGTNFVSGATVQLTKTGQAAINGSSVAVASDTQITCTFNLAGAATGLWNVVVTNPDGQKGTLTNGFTVFAFNPPPTAPTVTSTTPNSGFNNGPVNITNLAGTGFVNGASVQLTKSGQTSINGTNVVVVSTTQITCTFDLTGAAVGLWNAVVTNPDAQQGSLPNGFTVIAPAPTTTSITPNSSFNTGQVNITNLAGTGFVNGASVQLTKSGQTTINGTNVVVVSATRITCTFDLTGAAVGLWNAVVTNPDAQQGSLPGGFTVITAGTGPTVISVNPTDGAGGVSIYSYITATFSEAMNASTITAATFNLWQGFTLVAGVVNYDNANYTATFVPSYLAYNTTYTASISTAVTDLAGNHLASTYTWSFTTSQPPPTATVGIDAPDSVMAGSDFVVRVNVTQVTDLAGYDLKVTYDPAVIQIITPFPGQAAGTLWVTPGSIDSTVMPLTPPGFLPIGVQGTARIFGYFFPLAVVSGSGYLCEIHFHVVGRAGQNSDITLSEVDLYDPNTINIPYILGVGSGTIFVNAVTTMTTLTSSPNPSTYGQLVTFNTTVSAVSPASGIPTGGVTFKDGSTELGTYNLSDSGQATWNTSTLSIGSHTISALYNGDANFSGSTYNITQTVNQPPGLYIATIMLDNGDARASYSETLEVMNGSERYTWKVKKGDKLPPGLILRTNKSDTSKATISGRPSKIGTYTFIIQVTDATGALAEQPYTVLINPAVAMTVPKPPPGNTGVEYSLAPTASGGTGPGTYNWTITRYALPPGLTLNEDTGEISGEPTTSGTFFFTLTATDDLGGTASKALSIRINKELVITTTSLPNGDPGVTYRTTTLKATGGASSKTWSIEKGVLPNGLDFSPKGVIKGKPAGESSGDYPFTVQVSDGIGTATQDFSITIYEPLAITTTFTSPDIVGNPCNYSLMATGGGGGNKWIVTGKLPTGLTFNRTTNIISGTLTKAGTYKFTLKVTDSLRGTATEAVIIVVNPAT